MFTRPMGPSPTVGWVYTITLVGVPEPAVPPATPLIVASNHGGASLRARSPSSPRSSQPNPSYLRALLRRPEVPFHHQKWHLVPLSALRIFRASPSVGQRGDTMSKRSGSASARARARRRGGLRGFRPGCAPSAATGGASPAPRTRECPGNARQGDRPGHAHLRHREIPAEHRHAAYRIVMGPTTSMINLRGREVPRQFIHLANKVTVWGRGASLEDHREAGPGLHPQRRAVTHLPRPGSGSTCSASCRAVTLRGKRDDRQEEALPSQPPAPAAWAITAAGCNGATAPSGVVGGRPLPWLRPC